MTNPLYPIVGYSGSGLIVSPNQPSVVTGAGGAPTIRGQGSSNTVISRLPSLDLEVQGRGRFVLDSAFSGAQGVLDVEVLLPVAGTARTLCYLTDDLSGSNVVALRLDSSNRPFVTITDAFGVVVAELTPSGFALAAGRRVRLRMTWDATYRVTTLRHVSLKVDGVESHDRDWSTDPLYTWTPFRNQYLVSGQAYGTDADALASTVVWLQASLRGSGEDRGLGSGGARSPFFFDPSDYGTLAWWLRGDDLTLNGSHVVSWNDKSRQARHWVQGNPAKQPLAVANGINGMPGIQLDAANTSELLGPDLSALGLTAAETFIVLQRNTDPPPTIAEAGLWRIGNASARSVIPYTSGVIYDEFGTNLRKTSVNPSADMAAPCIYSVISTGSEWTNFLNGTQLYTTPTNTVGWASAPSLGGSGLGNWMDGILCEWIVFTHKLSTESRTAVKAALSSRYAIAMA